MVTSQIHVDVHNAIMTDGIFAHVWWLLLESMHILNKRKRKFSIEELATTKHAQSQINGNL